MMLVDGRQRVQSKFRRARGQARLVRPRQRPRRPAGHVRDPPARRRPRGESLVRTRAVPVRVRFVELSRERIEVVAGQALLGARAHRRARRTAGSSRDGEGSARARCSSSARPRAGLVHALRHGRRSCGACSGRRHPTRVSRVASLNPTMLERRARGTAMRRPFSERKYVRSVAMPGEYRPSGSRQRSRRRRRAGRRSASRASRRRRTAR